MSLDSRLTIISGSDASSIIRLRNPKTKDPIDLTDATKIQFSFKKRDRSQLVIDDIEIPATSASATYEEITFSSIEVGSIGNDIILVFDGIKDVDTIVQEWNNANFDKQVSHGGEGTEVLSSGTVRLTDGYDAYKPVELVGDGLLGKLRIVLLEKETVLLKRGPNQDFSVTIDYGAFPGGQRVKGFFDKLDVIEE